MGKKRFPAADTRRHWRKKIAGAYRELERVQQERDRLKKVVSIFSREAKCAYQFIEQHKQEFPIVVMCHVLEVSESAWYAWRKRPVCQRKREDAQLSSHIRQIFVSYREVYGSPRIHAQLADQGYRCSRKRIAHLMRENGISASCKRRRVVTTISRHGVTIFFRVKHTLSCRLHF